MKNLTPRCNQENKINMFQNFGHNKNKNKIKIIIKLKEDHLLIMKTKNLCLIHLLIFKMKNQNYTLSLVKAAVPKALFLSDKSSLLIGRKISKQPNNVLMIQKNKKNTIEYIWKMRMTGLKI